MSTAFGALARAVAKNRLPEFPLFVLAALVLVAIQITWAIHIDGEAESALRTAVAAQRPPFVWYETFAKSSVLAFGLSVFGGVIVAILVSNQQAIPARVAWLVFAVWGIFLTGGNLWSLGAPVGGFADRAGAHWFDRRGETLQLPWSNATKLQVGCRIARKPRRADLTYDVVFGRRKAHLGVRTGHGASSDWLASIADVRAALPPAVHPARLSFQWRCISLHSQRLSIDEDKALVALFNPTEVDAQRVARESSLWSHFISEVVAEQLEADSRSLP